MMKSSTPVPFESKRVFLKQVRSAELEEAERLALGFFFPGYHEGTGFGHAEVDASSPLKPLRDAGFGVVDNKHQDRRYAGDYTLPRSSYYTVCNNADGDDGGLLLRELSAYMKPHDSGLATLCDTTSAAEGVASLRAMLAPGKSAIFCFPLDLNHFPSPFRGFVGLDDRPDAQIAAIIPTRVVETHFDRLIDLRMPATRHWFTTELTRLTNENLPGRDGANVTMPVFPLAGPLDDFEKLLPTLLVQTLGGGPGATNVAGTWLRQIGAEALIFPSARADLSVAFSDGVLESWYGWNLVDYRDAPIPHMQAMIDFSPEWDRYPTMNKRDLVQGEDEDAAAPVQFSHVTLSAIGSGKHAGGLQVAGIEAACEMYFDFALWTHFTNRMHDDLDRALVYLTMLAGSDGKRGIYIDRLATVAQLFLSALRGDAQAKEGVIQLAALPQVSSEPGDHIAHLQSFLRLCN